MRATTNAAATPTKVHRTAHPLLQKLAEEFALEFCALAQQLCSQSFGLETVIISGLRCVYDKFFLFPISLLDLCHAL